VRVRPSPSSLRSLLALTRTLAPASRRLGLRVLIAGGAVRDLAEGRPPPAEWDLVVLAEAPGGARRLAGELARRWRWRAPVSFPRFGTHLVEGPAGRVEVSDSCLRTRLALQGKGLLERDALARDFTLNALYIDPLGTISPGRGAAVLDPTGRGAADLASGVLRTPLSPSRTFGDDPLRILRAARFAATRGYRPAPGLSRGARASVWGLGKVARERIRDEMDKLLLGERPSEGLRLLGRWGAFADPLPEVQAMVGFLQGNPHHFDDLFLHTTKTVDATPPDLATRWAALLHDCGKPLCRVETPAGCRFIGHEGVGERIARDALRRLRFSRRSAREVEALVRLHMVHYEEDWSDSAVRRLAARTGPLLPKVLDLLEADSRALKRHGRNTRGALALRARVAEVLGRRPLPVSPLTGREIMRTLGVGPGPVVGEAKEELARAAGEGEIPGGRDGARDFLLRWWRGLGGRGPRPSGKSRRGRG